MTKCVGGYESELDLEMKISVLTRVSPVADEYEIVWVPILMPLYRTENRRLAVAVGKTNAIDA